RYQRFRKQAFERLCSTRLICPRLGRKKAGGLKREIPYEDRESAKNNPFVLRKQVVTPIEHRIQSLMSGGGGSAAAPEQAEAIVEQLRNSMNPKRPGATRGKLDGEGDSIKWAGERAADARIGSG